ncbi:hypothetical protein [Pseudoalteromonas phage vB_PalP_Y7]|nr:hypothetical protein [Pseudoalteromonas phage vB_PalP_Y7]
MKATPLQKILMSMLVEKLISEDELFVPMPVTSKQHLLELKAQAGKIMLELAKEAGEDTSRMEESVAAAGEKAQAASASDKDESMSFDSISPNQFYGLIGGMKDKLKESVRLSEKEVNEARAIVKMGFEDGVGMVVFLTNSQSVYDTAEHADFPGEQNCGNPDCPGCNPKPTVVKQTIH